MLDIVICVTARPDSRQPGKPGLAADGIAAEIEALVDALLPP
jgi:hypothetical protein